MCYSLIGKYKEHRAEYNQENGTNYSLRRFMIDILQFPAKDVDEFLYDCTQRAIERRKQKEENIKRMIGKQKRSIRNANYTQILKYLTKDDTKDEYKKYYDIILEYSQYLKDETIRTKKCLADFLARTHRVKGKSMVVEVNKLHEIIYILKDLK